MINWIKRLFGMDTRQTKLYCIISENAGYLVHSRKEEYFHFRQQEDLEDNATDWRVAVWECPETMVNVLNGLTGDIFDFRKWTGPKEYSRKIGPKCKPADRMYD